MMLLAFFSLGDWGGSLLGWLQYALAVGLFAAGALGCVLPYPGTLVALGGCICWAIARGVPYPAAWVWVVLGLLALLGCFTDSIFALLGAKRFGCSRAAFWCSALGLFIGAFFFPFGLLLGPFLGAFLGELLLAQRSVGESTKSGAGALLGALLGMGAKFVVLGVMLLLFFW